MEEWILSLWRVVFQNHLYNNFLDPFFMPLPASSSKPSVSAFEALRPQPLGDPGSVPEMACLVSGLQGFEGFSKGWGLGVPTRATCRLGLCGWVGDCIMVVRSGRLSYSVVSGS